MRDSLKDFKQYTFSYFFDGSCWSIDVFAKNEKEAMRKIKAVANAKYDGELVVSIPVHSTKLSLWEKLKLLVFVFFRR